MSAKKKTVPPTPPKTCCIETFRTFGPYDFSTWESANEPSCFNGSVSIRKFRITIEEVEEPVEVLRERVQKLWDSCNNSHHWSPLRTVAETLGLELDFKTQHRNK